MTTRNITKVFRQAYHGPETEGMTWYQQAHDFARELCPTDVPKAAGVLAALSPRVSWVYNKKLAVRAFETGHATGHLTMCTTKADAILNGASPLTVLTSPKVSNFYRCILDPMDPNAVVVDRHAFDIYQGRVTPDTEKDVLKKKGVYSGIAHAYTCASRILTRETNTLILPSAVQAVTWCAWRNMPGKGRGIHRDAVGSKN